MSVSRASATLRSLVIGVVVALILAGCGTGMVSRSDLVMAGPTLPMPKVGTLGFAGVDEFTAMIAGARGRPVVVNVWASWCPPCRAEAPLLARAARAYKGRVVFVGVVSRDSPGAASKFIHHYALDYPNVIDRDNTIAPFLGVRGLPTTLVFGPDGRLRASISGGVSDQRLAAQLTEVLRQ